MKATRITISITESLYNKALETMKARDFDTFSGYVQHLIREEWETRQEQLKIQQQTKEPEKNIPPPNSPTPAVDNVGKAVQASVALALSQLTNTSATPAPAAAHPEPADPVDPLAARNHPHPTHPV